MARYHTASVVDNDDPDQRGRLRLLIPTLYSPTETYPGWVQPLTPRGAPGAAAMWWVPPVDAIVVVELTDGNVPRWSRAPVGDVNTAPAFLTGNYPRRSGFTSPGGAHSVALDDDAGLLILAADPDDVDGVANYISLDGAASEFKAGTVGGSLVLLNNTQAVLMNGAGDTLSMDSANGIVLVHNGGQAFLALESGAAKLTGPDLQITGGVVTVTASGGIVLTGDATGVEPTEPPPLGTSLLTDLSAAALEWQAAATAWGIPTPNTATLIAGITTSLAAGLPYLATDVEVS